MSTTETPSAADVAPAAAAQKQSLDALLGSICLEWWAALNDFEINDAKYGPNPNRPALAELRRIGTVVGNQVEELNISAAIGTHGFPAYLSLHRRLNGLLGSWKNADHLNRFSRSTDFDDAVAVVAATLARVREHKKGQVAKLLGAATGDEAPLMAEARFKRLIRTTTAPDLLDQGRRIVMLLGRTVPVDDLGASLLLWNAGPYAKRRWSFAYFDAEDMSADDADKSATAPDAAPPNNTP